MADTPLFQVGGLASGLDTTSIIDGLTKIEQQPLDTLRTQQTDFKTQVSVIGQLVGKIKALQQRRQDAGDERRGRREGDDRQHRLHGDARARRRRRAATRSRSSRWRPRRSRAPVGFTPDASRQHHGQGRHAVPDGAGHDLRSDHDHRRREPGRRRRRHPRAGRAGQRGRAQRRHASSTSRSPTSTPASPAPTARPRCRSPRPRPARRARRWASLRWAPARPTPLFTVDGLQFTRQSNTVTDAIPGTTLTLKGQTNTTETPDRRQRQRDDVAESAELRQRLQRHHQLHRRRSRRRSERQHRSRRDARRQLHAAQPDRRHAEHDDSRSSAAARSARWPTSGSRPTSRTAR